MGVCLIASVLSFQWDIPGLGNHKTARGIPITTAAVIGAGTMGSGIAMAMLNAGLPVTLVEQNDSVGSGGSDFLNANSIYYLFGTLNQKIRLNILHVKICKVAV